MRAILVNGIPAVAVWLFAVGCASTQQEPQAPPSPAAGAATKPLSKPNPHRAPMTARNNPTTEAGRGEPSLTDPARPAAWIYVDGQTGRYEERDGKPQMQWVIDTPVRPSPTFRVEVFDPLVSASAGFKFVLQRNDPTDEPAMMYVVNAHPGSFEVGRDYSLLNPGEQFVIRNWATGDVVRQIAALQPGQYLLAGTLGDPASGSQAVAVTIFKVGGN